MCRLMGVFICIFYIIPFLFAWNDMLLFELFVTLVILSSYYVGVGMAGYLVRESSIVDYSNNFYIHKKIYYTIFFLYFIFRFDYIFDIFYHLLTGSYFEWALQNAVDRYDGYNEKDNLFKVGSILFFIYSFLLPWSGFENRIKFIIYFFMIFVESSDLARAGVLLSLSSCFIELVIKHNKYLSELKFHSYFKYAFILVFFLLLVFLFSAYGRVSESDNIIDILSEKLSVYTMASYQAFLMWFKDADTLGSDFGFNTFTFAYKLIGVHVDQGFYKLVDTEFGSTNIYSGIRGLLADFGLIFTVVFYLSSGFLFCLHSRIKMNLFSYLSIRFSLLMIVYFIISPFIFFTYTSAFVISFLILILNKYE